MTQTVPQDICLWVLTADKNGLLEPEVPLPVSHDAFKRQLVHHTEGKWFLTDAGRELYQELSEQ